MEVAQFMVLEAIAIGIILVAIGVLYSLIGVDEER